MMGNTTATKICCVIIDTVVKKYFLNNTFKYDGKEIKIFPKYFW